MSGVDGPTHGAVHRRQSPPYYGRPEVHGGNGPVVHQRLQGRRPLIARARQARPLSDWVESESGLDVDTWSHFLRKTGIHFSGKCSKQCRRLGAEWLINQGLLAAALMSL